MFEAAAFWPSRTTRSMPGPRVTMSRKLSVPADGRRERRCASSIASTLSALAIAARSRSGEAGLTTKSKAPARIAETTVSMPPCAVCTITGSAMPRSRIVLSTPSPSMPGMARSRMIAAMSPPRGPSSAFSAASPPSATISLMAEFRDGALEQAALHRIVVDNEDRCGHIEVSRNRQCRMIVVWIILAQGSK